LTLVCSESGLVGLEFGSAARQPAWLESEEKTSRYRRELQEYLSGRRRQFDFPLDLHGTDFQKRCWKALLDIPYGETRTYAEIAHAVGKPQAFRAVGMANNRNPAPIVVPCHRVIASDGSLCGYGGGLDIKEKLLRLEGAR
jgi:O-6-methylguanine DNA methyltransferase